MPANGSAHNLRDRLKGFRGGYADWRQGAKAAHIFVQGRDGGRRQSLTDSSNTRLVQGLVMRRRISDPLRRSNISSERPSSSIRLEGRGRNSAGSGKGTPSLRRQSRRVPRRRPAPLEPQRDSTRATYRRLEPKGEAAGSPLAAPPSGTRRAVVPTPRIAGSRKRSRLDPLGVRRGRQEQTCEQ